MNMDMSPYKDLFLSEVKGHLAGMSETIIALEKEPGERERIDSLFRAAHSIKGMAASMGYNGIAQLSHTMEDLMDHFRRGTYVFDAEAADLLLEGADLLSEMVADVESGGTGSRDITALVARLSGYSPGQTLEGAGGPDEPVTAGALLTEPLPGDQQKGHGDGATGAQTVRVKTEVLDTLINITGELTTNKNRLLNIAQEVDNPLLAATLSDLSRYLRELHTEVLKVRMMPFAVIADRFSRPVRDLARKSGKEISLEITGKDIELDRGILQELTDPLLHILRNAVDHGLELPDDRRASGKPATGTIAITVCREKDRVNVTVADDGRGMAPSRIITAAIEKGLISKQEAELLSPRQALMLTCLPGFSTASQVTDVSGRGVGMDAVRSSIQSLGGSLAIESEPGKGSRFILSLPLTISIIQVLLVACSTMVVAFPVSKVLRTVDIRRDAIITRGKRKVFRLDDEEIPLIALHRLLGVRLAPIKDMSIPAVVVEMRGRMVALVVDRLIGQQDVFVKPIGKPLNRVKGFFGGAVLGDGSAIFILDPANLL